MITCKQAESLFDAYLNGEIGDSLRCELHAHQLRCSSCRRALAILQTSTDVIARDRGEPALSGDFTDRLLACLDEQRPAAGAKGRRWRRIMLWGGSGLSAAAIVLFALTAWLTRSPTSDSSGEVAGAFVSALEVFPNPKVYPVAHERMAATEELAPGIVPFWVGYLAESGASAVQDGLEGLSAFAELGQLGFLRANNAILVGAAEADDGLIGMPAVDTELIDLENVEPLLELSDLLRSPPAPAEAVDLI